MRLPYLLSVVISLFPLAALAEAPNWKIGVSAPLSGDVAAWGIDTQRAVELANEMLGKGQFRVIFEDDKCQGQAAASAANKLISIDKVNFGMIVCTEPTLSAAPIFERNKVVVVAPGATGAAVSNAGDYIFRTWPSDSKMVELVFNYVASRFKHPAIITESRGFPEEFSRVFSKLAAERSLSLLSESFLSDESNFRSFLLKLKQSNPDVLILSTDSERTLLELVKQVRSYNWDVPLVGQYIAGTAGFYEKAGDLANGFVFGDSPDIDCSKDKPGCAVYNEFIKRFGAPKASAYMVASSIASFMAIADAARSGQLPKDHLYQAKLSTLIGELTFDSNGDVVGPKHTLKVLAHGKPRILAFSQGGE